MADYVLTTFDNPWNPFTDFKQWLERDHDLGHYTLEKMASFCKTSPYLDDEDNEYIIDECVKEFLSLNPDGIHYKVYKDEADKLIPLMYNSYQEYRTKETKDESS